ncbi:dynamin family protein [Kibdelosporangium persicum]|uniref:Replication fork clamp-binding protein CrfC n=1 Tax=Kibdelosporangium persicum TaxID=2698649 RepID=A0ABX2FIP0_9PSEU|nr:dynamin family protein [Kibdelosporangium persicum]NRN71275.1 Replication fork clamp-binding protein CrfC [Kibdelosporangium persicum]
MTAATWLEVLDQTIGASVVHHRPDLAERLRAKRAQLLDPQIRVLVIGEANQGKSQLVNALVSASVCAVGDDVTTVAPTIVRYAEKPAATQLLHDGTGAEPQRMPLPVDQATNRGGDAVTTEVRIPRKILAAGLVIIDTPAIGNLHQLRAQSTFSALSGADAVLLATDASHELSATELELLRHVRRSCPTILVALTKIDLTTRWRQIADRNREHLSKAGIPAAVVPVSSALRLRAVAKDDEALNVESGFPELIERLRTDVLPVASNPSSRQNFAAMTGTALAELVGQVKKELAARPDDRNSPAVAEYMDAQQKMADLKRRSAKWQNVLNDEMADLIADLEYDLRDRTRRILREVDRAFDEADPAKTWDQFEEWLNENLTEAARTNFDWLIERSWWVADRVAECFPERQDLVPGTVIPSDADLDPGDTERPRLEKFTAGQKVFSGLRGSYGGVLMFGLITSLAGLPLINPISIGAGLALGGKSIGEEGETRLKRRQQLAKSTAQRHVDDFFLRFSKDCKDAARRIQRGLRDHFAELAEQLQQRVADAASAAQRSAQAELSARQRRDQELRQALTQLRELHGQITRIAGALPASSRNPLEISA